MRILIALELVALVVVAVYWAVSVPEPVAETPWRLNRTYDPPTCPDGATLTRYSSGSDGVSWACSDGSTTDMGPVGWVTPCLNCISSAGSAPANPTQSTTLSVRFPQQQDEWPPKDVTVVKPGRMVCELPADEKLEIRKIVEEEIEAALRSRVR